MPDHSEFPPWTPAGPFPMRVVLRCGTVVTIRDESTMHGYRFTSDHIVSVGCELTFMDSGHYLASCGYHCNDIVGPDPGEGWELVPIGDEYDNDCRAWIDGAWIPLPENSIGKTRSTRAFPCRRPITTEPDATLPAGEIEELRAEIERLTKELKDCKEQSREAEMDSANYRGTCGVCNTANMDMLTDHRCMACELLDLRSKLAESQEMDEARAFEIASRVCESGQAQYLYRRPSEWLPLRAWGIRRRPCPDQSATFTGTPDQLAALAKAAEEIGLSKGAG